MADNLTDTQAAVEAGAKAVTAAARVTWLEHPLDSKIRVPLTIEGNGSTTIDTDAIATLAALYSARPRTGTTTLTEVDSFIAHVKRWSSDATVIYADINGLGFTAVLDDHPPGPDVTAARQHRATYACPRSAEWRAWTELDGKPQSQAAFAAFIEARLEDMIGAAGKPSPVEVLDMSRRLQIYTKGTFERQIANNGDSVLVVKRETDVERSTPIPRAFMIGIPVFTGATKREPIEVRIQSALESDKMTFTLTLYRRVEIERDAFGEVRAKVAAETSRLVLAGTP